MARAIAISLLVIAVLTTSTGLTFNINQSDNCWSYDSSYFIEKAQFSAGIQKINKNAITSLLGTYYINSTFYVRESSVVAFRLIVAEGFVDIQANDCKFVLEADKIANKAVYIANKNNVFTLTCGEYTKTFNAYNDETSVSLNVTANAFKLTSLEDNCVNYVKLQHKEKFTTNIVGAIGHLGAGNLIGNDLLVDDKSCGKHYSVVFSQSLDLIFYDFLITFSEDFNITIKEGVLRPPNFCYSLNLEILSIPQGATVSISQNITLLGYGLYKFRLYNEYESFNYVINYIDDTQHKPEEPDDTEQPGDKPSVPEGGESSNPDLPNDENNPSVPEGGDSSNPDLPSDENKPSMPDGGDSSNPDLPSDENKPSVPDGGGSSNPDLPSEENKPNIDNKPNDKDVLYKTLDWIKIGLVIGGFLAFGSMLIAIFILLNRKKNYKNST